MFAPFVSKMGVMFRSVVDTSDEALKVQLTNLVHGIAKNALGEYPGDVVVTDLGNTDDFGHEAMVPGCMPVELTVLETVVGETGADYYLKLLTNQPWGMYGAPDKAFSISLNRPESVGEEKYVTVVFPAEHSMVISVGAFEIYPPTIGNAFGVTVKAKYLHRVRVLAYNLAAVYFRMRVADGPARSTSFDKALAPYIGRDRVGEYPVVVSVPGSVRPSTVARSQLDNALWVSMVGYATGGAVVLEFSGGRFVVGGVLGHALDETVCVALAPHGERGVYVDPGTVVRVSVGTETGRFLAEITERVRVVGSRL